MTISPYHQILLSGSDKDGIRSFIIEMNEKTGELTITKMEPNENGQAIIKSIEVLNGTVDFLFVHKTFGLNFKKQVGGKHVSV